MNERKSETDSVEPKMLGLPRHLAGGLIGVIVFESIIVFRNQFRFDMSLVEIIFTGLIFPGAALWFIMGMLSESQMPLQASLTFLSLMAYGFSSIPAGLLGSFLISTKKPIRTIGIVFLVIYFLFVFGCGSMFYRDFG